MVKSIFDVVIVVESIFDVVAVVESRFDVVNVDVVEYTVVAVVGRCCFLTLFMRVVMLVC